MPAAPIVLIHGDERHLVDEAAHRWLAAARATGADVEILDAPASLEPLRRSLCEVPLFDPQRYVLLRDPPQAASSGKRAAAGELAATLALRAPTTQLCIVLHSSLTAAHPLLAAVREAGGSIDAFPALKGRDLRGFVDAELRRRQLGLPRGAVEHLLAVSSSSGEIVRHLDKLQAYAQGRPLTLETVCELAGGAEQAEVWGVLEQLLGAAPARGAAALDALLDEGRPTQYLLAVLAGQIRDLILAQALIRRGSRRPADLAAAMKLPGWRAERVHRQAQSVPLSLTEGWLRRLQHIDAASKRGELTDSDALRAFALRAAAEVAARRPAAGARRRA